MSRMGHQAETPGSSSLRAGVKGFSEQCPKELWRELGMEPVGFPPLLSLCEQLRDAIRYCVMALF